jgi:hypothetical protein
MLIKNYNPDEIKAAYEDLVKEVEDFNYNHKQKFKQKTRKMVLINIAIWVVTLGLFFNIFFTNNLVFSWIFMVMGTIAIITTIATICIFVDGPKVERIDDYMTFAMRFWQIYTNNNVLSIERTVFGEHVNIASLYLVIKDENGFINKKMLLARDVYHSDETKESYLDVANGYIVEPIRVERNIKFE